MGSDERLTREYSPAKSMVPKCIRAAAKYAHEAQHGEKLPPVHPGVADRFLGLAEILEQIFSRPVDLLTENMIRNPVLREEVNRDRTLIYDHGSQKTAA